MDTFAAALPLVLWVLFGAGVALSTTAGLVLSYHWLRFAMHPLVPAIGAILYTGVCFFLLSIMFSVIDAL